MDWWGAAGGPRAGPLPAQRQANGPQDCHQSMGVASISCNEVRHVLGKDPTPAGEIAAAEFPHGQLDLDGPLPPGQVCQATLVAAMHGSGQHGTAWTGGGQRCRGELEPYRLVLNGHFQEADSIERWE
jgi:hypothetical protein